MAEPTFTAPETDAIEAKRHAAIGKAIERAAAELPRTSQIRIDLERDAACVYWLDRTKGVWWDVDGCSEPFAEQIGTAIDSAILAQKGGKQ